MMVVLTIERQIHNDDISNILILNKKAITSQEAQLFKSELEKFRPHQSRILQANHKQSSLMKELTRTYSELLQDKRVRGEQNKYEAFSRQRNVVLSKYRKVYQAYTDLQAGLDRAKVFYEEMRDTVDSLNKNVEGFVENRRSEGGQLLGAIEAAKGSGSADREQARMKELMERMSLSPSTNASGHSQSPVPADQHRRPPPLQNLGGGFSASSQPQQPSSYNPARSPPISPGYPNGPPPPNFQSFQQNGYPSDRRQSYGYNPNTYGPVSPPAHQQYFSPPPGQYGGQQPSTTTYGALPQQSYSSGQNLPAGWQPPPPPPGPPPQQTDYSSLQASNYPSGPGGYATDPRRSAPQGGGGDPWAGLSNWK